ncbi:hypothetical protein [Streptomyces sp. HPF1205]|uniref:hypothetical protein n=1 Tax=Streptomyces sp. HPF1205 TaxID=2873262 RepID=UPI001CECCF6A|nr:hypothetical protein [Streptomyces sp. HPF1205]
MATPTTAPASACEPDPHGPQARRYGVPSPALLALADRGLARFFLKAEVADPDPEPARAPAVAGGGSAGHRDDLEQQR